MRVFLDIDIGDRGAFSTESEAYRISEDFHGHIGRQLGITGTFASLGQEEKLLLAESFARDPKWASKAKFTADKPKPLHAGRVVIELYQEQVPKTVQNFKCLVTGEKGKGKTSGKPLHYKGCAFHRAVSSFIVQGGDIVRGDGSGGDSIYGGKFNDEKNGLKLKHDKLGVVAMANSGKNSNTSQFYITLKEQLPQLDGKHVIFGHVVEGLDILRRVAKREKLLEKLLVDADEEVASLEGRPKQAIWIANSGTL